MFRIAVKSSEWERFGQNMEVEMAQFEVAVESMPCWDGDLIKKNICIFP